MEIETNHDVRAMRSAMRRCGGHGLLVRAAAASTSRSSSSRSTTTTKTARTVTTTIIPPAFEDAALTWARQHPESARACLEVPPPVERARQLFPPVFRTLEEFWSQRHWVLTTDHEKALVSHVLSAPLTVLPVLLLLLNNNRSSSSSISSQQEGAEEGSSAATTDYHHHVCFVGARAEASLPVQYWRELLGLLDNASSRNNDDDTISSPPSRPQHYHLHFTGPELIPRPNVSLFLPPRQPQSRNDPGSTTTIMTLQWHQPCKLHELVVDDDVPLSFDVLICLNPGFGHDHLRDSWRPSLPSIFHQRHDGPERSTSPNVLVTAHSALDAARDATWLRDECGIDITYRPNPFASRIRYLDPFQTTTDDHGQQNDHSVQPNLYYAIYRSDGSNNEHDVK
jgi:hypothetical protein